MRRLREPAQRSRTRPQGAGGAGARRRGGGRHSGAPRATPGAGISGRGGHVRAGVIDCSACVDLRKPVSWCDSWVTSLDLRCPRSFRPGGIRRLRGGAPVNVQRADKPEPITYEEAAKALERTPSALRDWVTRYNARRLGKVGRRMYLDYRDLATIDGCMHRGEPVPATPEERDEIRARVR